jgi:hypothetical protein
MRTQADRKSDLNVGRLIEAYEEYIGLLTESERSLLGLAHAHGHGYRCPDASAKRGEELRARIAKLKSAVLAPSR